MRCQTFSTPKAGNAGEDYEDAAFGDPVLGRFAVADGATESTFASLWAELLVKGYVQSPLVAHEWEGWLRPLQENWLAQVSGLSLPWYAEEKLAQTGAYAAFLGVSINRDAGDNRGQWRAAAVGDSCLFQIRDGRLRRRFPMRRSDDFGTSPWLIGSREQPERFSASGVAHWKTGEWQTRDRLWLMTDALAQWFLRQNERRRAASCPCASVSKLLEKAAAPDDFACWIGALRESGELRNDDVTLLAIDL